MRDITLRALTLAIPLVAIGLAGCGGGDDDVVVPFADRCTQLAGKTVGTSTILTTTLADATAAQPQTCQASGQIVSSPTSTIKFRIDLPEDSTWNKKLLHIGGGGYNGSIPTAESIFGTFQGNNVRQRGYVIVGSDSGHQSASPFDLSFALNNPTGFDNFAFNSVPQVYTAALAIVQSIYGAAPTKKYFYGQSTGGREALQQAQRFPENYDGIIALEPTTDYDSVIQKGIATAKLAFSAGGAGWMSPTKIKLLDDAQVAACDGLDGISDGIISNPEACHFDIQTLRCPAGADTGNTCLSDAQLASAQALRTSSTLPVALANGLTTVPPWGIGGEADAGGGWAPVHFGASPTAPSSVLFLFSDQWLKFAVTSSATTTVLGYTLGSDAQRWMDLSTKANSSNPDLSAFSAHGGKLILWHGWSDFLVPPGYSSDYYKRVVSGLGQGKTDSFIRFFTSPGVTHFGTGPGAPIVDRITALESWVENGTAPEVLTATRFAADKVTPVFTRPNCRYPAWPKYKGTGDQNAAANFTCVLQ